jgi:hypothetical protein
VRGLGEWLTTRRIAGIAGLGYFIGVAIENQEVLTSPTLSSSVADIRASYADRAFAIVTSFAGALALLSYAAFVAALYIWLRQRERVDEPWATIALVGGIGGPVVAAAGLSADAILIAGSDAGANDDVARALFDFYLLCRIVSGLFVALFLGGIGVASLRSRSLPRPLAVLALAIALPMALAPFAAFDQEPGLELAVGVAFAAQTLWIFLTSMWLTLADALAPLAFIRRSAFLLLVLAAGLIGIGLLAAPGATGEFFAWQLKPEPLAAFAGGVYIGSATAYALALPCSARQVRGLVFGAIVLSVSVFIVTLAHTDQFDFDRLQAIMWVVLFAAFSLVMIGLFVFERDENGARPARLPGWVRAVFGAVGIAGGALALALWIDPVGLAGPSPFDLPPLGGRFAGSWVALLAVLCGWAAVRDRADEARLSAFALVALPAGALVAALRTIEQLDPPGAAAAYIAILVLLVLAGAAVTAASKGRARRPDTRAKP